jgi:hypothetical protein
VTAEAGVFAQKVLIDRFISWERVEARLKQYNAINRAFPLTLLKSRINSPPYFCHYMTWRLGVWENESLFERLEELLLHAESLPKWESERGLLESAEYSDFWSLVWQLQVAEYLSSAGSDVRWCGAGPDLAVTLEKTTLFVECYTYRKAFGLRIFLQDLLAEVGSDIKLDSNWFLPFILPAELTISEFIDVAVRPFLDEDLIARLRIEALDSYPVKVVEPGGTLVVYLTGPNDQAYDPSVLSHLTGDPEVYLDLIVKEAIGNKTHSNGLATHHPNLVAVSYLLSAEAAAAIDLRGVRRPVALGPNIDALGMSLIGIDERLSRTGLILVQGGEPSNPVLNLIADSL